MSSLGDNKIALISSSILPKMPCVWYLLGSMQSGLERGYPFPQMLS